MSGDLDSFDTAGPNNMDAEHKTSYNHRNEMTEAGAPEALTSPTQPLDPDSTCNDNPLDELTGDEQVAVETEVRYITNDLNEKLYCRYWRPVCDEKDVRGVIFICHGYAEHLECYSELAMSFAKNKIFAFGHDHKGHGLSYGAPGLVDSIDTLAADVFFHATRVKDVFVQKPFYIYGHSMGGLITLRCIIRNRAFFRGMILEAPLIEMDPAVKTAVNQILAKAASYFLPNFPTEKLSLELVTGDRAMQDKLKNDPLRFKGATKVKTASTFFEQTNLLNEERLLQIRIPFLCLHGKDDKICLPKGSEKLFSSCIAKDKTLVVIPDARHHLLLEREEIRNEVIKTSVNWLKLQAAKPYDEILP